MRVVPETDSTCINHTDNIWVSRYGDSICLHQVGGMGGLVFLNRTSLDNFDRWRAELGLTDDFAGMTAEDAAKF